MQDQALQAASLQQIADIAQQLLGRINLTGTEVAAYCAANNMLEDIKAGQLVLVDAGYLEKIEADSEQLTAMNGSEIPDPEPTNIKPQKG